MLISVDASKTLILMQSCVSRNIRDVESETVKDEMFSAFEVTLFANSGFISASQGKLAFISASLGHEFTLRNRSRCISRGHLSSDEVKIERIQSVIRLDVFSLIFS
jgi:hypothetical protein